MSQNNAKISADYSAKVHKKFEENNGKLFLVDYSKSCALVALNELLTERKDETLFCLVDDAALAQEFADALTPVVGEITVIDDYASFTRCLQQSGGGNADSDTSMQQAAEAFKNRFPRVLITKNDKGNATLFHRALCKDTTKRGVYNGEANKRSYCISDFFGACRYDFAVVDNVYGKLSFESPVGKKKYACGEYEKIFFLGETFYVPTAYSLQRLRNVIDGAKHAVVISDIVVASNAVQLYAVLELLHGDFPYADVRKKIAATTNSYAEDCERACTDLSYCREDENIISTCLQKLKGSKQNVPSDIQSLKNYLNGRIEYMSEEEIFLRLVSAQVELRFHGACNSLESVLESFEAEPDEMANCICEVFFREPLKTEFESVLQSAHICKMTDTQIAAMFAVFLKYGVYHPFPQKNDGCRILRLKRDDSGFEAFVREQHEAIEDEDCYSITKEGSARLYKCIAVERMLDGRAQGGAKSPVVIVAKRNLDKIRELLQKLLPSYVCTQDVQALAQDTRKKETVVLVDYAFFRKTSLWLHAHTVVFFDVLADAVVFKNLINKALRYREVQVYAIVNYGDLSGRLMDVWQEDLLSTRQKAMPIDNAEISLKDGRSASYTEIVTAAEAMYSALEKLTSVGQKKLIAGAIEQYNKLLSEYTLRSTVSAEESEEDFTYLIAMSKYFNGVFKNCISIGGAGEEVLVHTQRFVKVSKEVKTGKKDRVEKTKLVEERNETTGQRRIYFNVCSAMLRRTCDGREKNCNGCSAYARWRKNDYWEFRKNAETLFAKTKEFVATRERLRLMENLNKTINSQSGDGASADCLVLEEIERYEAEAQAAFEKIEKVKQDKRLFSVEYALVAEICAAVQKTYCKLLRKYYGTVTDVFERATEQAKQGFKTISDSFLSAHEGV